MLQVSCLGILALMHVTGVAQSRRLGNSWRLSVEARLFHSDDSRDALFALRRDDYLQLTLEKFY